MDLTNRPEYDTPNMKASDAVAIYHAQIKIEAQASLVFRSLRNTETWKDWNRFVPKVTVTWQPPDEDVATAEEIRELVQNTSLIGSFYSDLTDGGNHSKNHGPDDVPPPRFRLNSLTGRVSVDEGGPPRSMSEAGDRRVSTTSQGSGGKSSAQMFAEAQAARRASIATGEVPKPMQTHQVMDKPRRSSVATGIPGSPSLGKNKGMLSPMLRAKSNRAHIMSQYGEPSVRLQNGTKCTFHSRMKRGCPNELSESSMVVLEVARPDDPVLEPDTTALTRSKTHNLDRSGTYRVTWATDSSGGSSLNLSGLFTGSKVPKFLLHAERVNEIIPQFDERGNESCIYRTWELQKGPAAKVIKKKHGDYVQKMFEVWASGLKGFCESLNAPQVQIRDFSIDEEVRRMSIMSDGRGASYTGSSVSALG